MIYDYSNGFQNATVMVADSGKLSFSEDKKYLILRLYSGESFENLNQQQQRATKTQKNVPYRRETFAQKQMLIDSDAERWSTTAISAGSARRGASSFLWRARSGRPTMWTRFLHT